MKKEQVSETPGFTGIHATERVGDSANIRRYYRQKRPMKLAVIMLDRWHHYRQKSRFRMSLDRQNDSVEPAQLTRRGKPVYESNPSIVGRFPVRVVPRGLKKGARSSFMIAPDTGEVLGGGAFGFIEEREVDSEQFVKVYLDGIRQYGQLSKAGAILFELVYREISGMSGKDRDTVSINFMLANRWKSDLTRRTYERGLNELLEKEFLFRSLAADVYFVNVRFMFNGDRMVVVKEYRRKGSAQQQELPLGPALIEGSSTGNA